MSQGNHISRFAAARFAGELSPEERRRRYGVSAPSGRGAEFDEFIASWGRNGEWRLSADTLRQLLSDADRGSSSGLACLFREMLEKEPAIAAHMQTRILSVLSCDWSVQGEDSVKAGEAESILKKAGIHALLRHLLDALAFGYSGAAIVWEKGGAGIREFKRILPENWVFDLSGNPALLTLSGQEKALSSYHPFQFVFHVHCLKSGSPPRGGLLRPLLWVYFFKHYAMRDRARYLERYGIPFLAAKIRREDFESEELRSAVMNSLSKMGSDGVGLLSEGAEMQVLSSSSGSSSNDYQSWMDYIDRLCALLILGQTASSGDASGFSKGQQQENVRRDLIEADCRSLMESVDMQILHPLERWLFGSEGTLHFHLDYSSPENLLEKAQIVRLLSESGFRADPQWIMKTFGISLEKKSNTTPDLPEEVL